MKVVYKNIKRSEYGKNYHLLDSSVIIVVTILKILIIILCQDLSSTFWYTSNGEWGVIIFQFQRS